ncbi:ATP-binding cassette domain-containing protein [Actinosynnema pretiosum]|uniref:ABC transporter n=1 Tax=Actinosynnema pretiosum TaxID=42197 RepID=A0A290Z3X8_9PSEU|nr:ATP-binding cassette domain-containing protein [Actinosynnema pretiosum]ATE53736.1 ABC transporter [Actinosynnema pretiosum]
MSGWGRGSTGRGGAGRGAGPGSAGPSAVRLDGVGKRYGRGPWVLRGVDLDVPAGGLVVVAGGNGVGKSTLLRVAAGLVRPDEGRVARAGDVGYLPERFPPDVRFSARNYLRHLAAVRGVPGRWELVEALGFAGDPDGPMSALSKGNAQKVALAQALHARGLVVLDEPWSGLDARAGAALAGLVEAARADGVGVLVTDHTGRELAGARQVVLGGGRDRVVVVELDRAGAVFEQVEAADGVLVAERGGDAVRLEVEPGRSDEVLALALRLGCSVRGVRS